MEEVALEVCLKDGAGWCSRWRERLAKAQRENTGCGAGRDPSEGGMQSSAKCQSQAVLLAITSLVSSWVGAGWREEKKAGLDRPHFPLFSHGLGVQDQEPQLPFLELKKKIK